MASLYNADLKPLSGNKTHPYDHATKLFIADNYRLAPKQSFLYYVCININQDIFNSLAGLFSSDGISSQGLQDQMETGLLAKRVDLPRFSIDTKTMNAYNRKNIVQNKISYDPIGITFHDDTADVVTNFWNDYYTYYYRDSDYGDEIYRGAHKYSPRLREGWGYTPRLKAVQPFLKSIQIFSLHNKRFTEYRLINPTITSWRHGEHNSYESSGILENSMTVAFETVKYRTGYINVTEMPGFGTIHYDNYDSPISTSKTNIYTDAGLIGAVGGAGRDLSRPDGTGSGKGVTSSILDAYRLYNNLKNVNIKNAVNTTIGQVGVQIIGGVVNGAVNGVFVPTLSGSPGYGGVYGGSQVYNNGGTVGVSPYASPLPNNLLTIGGTAVNQAIGTGVSYTTDTVNNWTRGVVGSFTPQNGVSTTVYQTLPTSGTVALDRTGQPVTGQFTSVVLDANGTVISRETVSGDNTGAYVSTNPSLNLDTTTYSTDSDGNTVATFVYRDGTRVVETIDFESGDTLTQQIYPGKVTAIGQGGGAAAGANNNTTPTNTRTAVAQGGLTNSAPQTITDPRTGIVYAVGNTTTAQITNSITQGVGAGAGLYVGQSVFQALNNTGLGKSVFGQVVSGVVSGAAGAAAGAIVNNTLQPIVGAAVGGVAQLWDDASGSIRNVVGSWKGTGDYIASDPKANTVLEIKNYDADENLIGYTYLQKSGQRVTVDANKNVISTEGGGLFGPFKEWVNGMTNFSNPGLPGIVPTGTDGSTNWNGYVATNENPDGVRTFPLADQGAVETQELTLNNDGPTPLYYDDGTA